MLVDRLARWVLAFDPAQVPAEVQKQAKLLLLNTLGCALAARQDPTARTVLGLLDELSGSGDCTVIGQARRASAAEAVLANGVLVRTLDLNDIYLGPRQIGHPSDNLPVALAIGEQRSSSGRELLAAILLGYELYGRLLDLMDPAGPWDHVTVSGLVAPAMAGRLLGLDAERLADALALGATHSNVLGVVRTGQLSAAKALSNALVASGATLQTLLAARGLSGPRHVLEDSQGLGQTVFDGAELEALLAPPEAPFRLMEVMIKAYPCLGTGQAVVAAALRARAKLAERRGGVERIELRMADSHHPRVQAADPARRRPSTRETADHSFYYLAAVALLDGELTHRQFEGQRWLDPALQALMDRITIYPDPALSAGEPGSHPCVLTFTTTDHDTFTVEVPHAPGHPRNRLSASEVQTDFRDRAGGLLTRSDQDAVVQGVTSLESLASVRPLLASLRG